MDVITTVVLVLAAGNTALLGIGVLVCARSARH